MSRYVIGIDGGGSSTVAWVADESGRVVGRAEAGPSNMKAVGVASGLAALDATIRGALADAGVDRVEVACLGLAGVDRPEDRDLVERWNAERAHARRLILVNDGELVLAAGTPEGWGVAVIAGTGSICVGRSQDGRYARAGGWGHIFGDEGSGYGTAVAALRHVARVYDGREDGDWRLDPLCQAICEAVGVVDPAGLVTAIYGPDYDRARIARLAAEVVRIASPERLDSGELADPAAELLVDAGLELGRIVHAVSMRLDLPLQGLPLAIAGGFVLSSEIVRSALTRQLANLEYRIVAQCVEEPVQGAIVLARRALAKL